MQFEGATNRLSRTLTAIAAAAAILAVPASASATARSTVTCRVGQYTHDRHYGLLYDLKITMTKRVEDGSMPRCGVGDFTADRAWDRPGNAARVVFKVGGARWDLGQVICSYRFVGSGDNEHIGVRCTHGTTVVTFGMGN